MLPIELPASQPFAGLQQGKSVLGWNKWKAQALSGGCLPNSTNESWNTRMKGAFMIVEIIVAVVTCATSVINAIFAALSYFKDKE